MLALYGRRLYGRCDRVGDACVATVFAYVNYVPVVPLGSYLVVSGDGTPNAKLIRIRMHWRSAALGLLRGWGVIAGATGLGALAAVGALFVVAGRLSDDAVAQRLVYKQVAAHAVDVGLYDVGREHLATELRKWLDERAPAPEAGYRGGKSEGASERYREVALDPNTTDRAYLRAAFTLARLDEVAAPRARRAGIRRARMRIWARLAAERAELAPKIAAARPRNDATGLCAALASIAGAAAVYAFELRRFF